MKKITLFLAGAFMSTFLNAQNINFSDANFKSALLAHGATQAINGMQPITGSDIKIIDTNGDREISVSEAQDYTGHINVGNRLIRDLTGIEFFTQVKHLSCNRNELRVLDVSKNIDLKYLDCSRNLLSELDLSKNTICNKLYVGNNKIKNLDVSMIPYLNTLNCGNNELTSLNIATGRNEKSLHFLNTTNNRWLSCIKHDTGFLPRNKPTVFDPYTGNAIAGWFKDTTASWSNNCAPASTNDVTFNNAVTLYPNPVSSKLYINAENANISSVKIYNILGREVISATQKQVDVSDLPNGMYILKVLSSEGKVATKKFIKQ